MAALVEDWIEGCTLVEVHSRNTTQIQVRGGGRDMRGGGKCVAVREQRENRGQGEDGHRAGKEHCSGRGGEEAWSPSSCSRTDS